MNIDACTMNTEGRAYLRSLPLDDLKELLTEVTDDVLDIEGQLEDRADDSDEDAVWRQKATTALTYRKRIQRFLKRVIEDRQNERPEIEVTFMRAAAKLLDPQTFNTILLAADKYSKTEA